MSDAKIHLPTSDNRPTISAWVSDAEILTTGSVVINPNYIFYIHVDDITIEVNLINEAVNPEIKTRQVGLKTVRFTLDGFTSVYGTAVGPVSAGKVGGKPIWLSLFVQAMSNKVKNLSYTLYWGGNIG